MPLAKVDYSKTIIYKIQHKEIDELLYVGSTTDFTRRKAQHKRVCNNTNDKSYNLKLYSLIRNNGGFDCFNMIIIKEFPCSNKREAEAEEDKVIREARANMNGQRAFVTPEDVKEQSKQHYELNKEYILEREKQHYELNKEHILERRKQYRLEHKDEIAERIKQHYELNKEHILERQKQHYELNKEHILERQKQHYEQNKERLAEQKKQYREQNKERIAEYHKQHYKQNKELITERQKQYYEQNKEQKKQKITCDCGCIIRKDILIRHQRTKKHQDLLDMTEK